MESSPVEATWSFLTSHARVLICLAQDPAVRLRELGERVEITERAAFRIVDELVAAGYVSRSRDGRRNRYTVHHDLPLPDQVARSRALGDLLRVLVPSWDASGIEQGGD